MNTSIRIQQYLEMNSNATVEQLSHALDLTKADIHYHIRLMLKKGIIGLLPEPYQKGAGRPARQFFLVKPAPESLSRVIIALMTKFITENVKEQPRAKELGYYLACGILDYCCGSSTPLLSPTIRLTRIIRELSGYGIYLRWLARKDGPSIYVEQEYLSTLFNDPTLVRLIIESLLSEIQKRIV